MLSWQRPPPHGTHFLCQDNWHEDLVIPRAQGSPLGATPLGVLSRSPESYTEEVIRGVEAPACHLMRQSVGLSMRVSLCVSCGVCLPVAAGFQYFPGQRLHTRWSLSLC